MGIGGAVSEKAKTPKTIKKCTDEDVTARYGIATAIISPSPALSYNIGANYQHCRFWVSLCV